MQRRTLLILAVGFMVMVPAVQAAQQSRWTPSKALTTDFSGDGNMTWNASSLYQVNGTVSLGHWGSYLVGNITNATLTANRTWTYPDASGTVLLGPAPSFTDYSNAGHDHLDADDGGTLSADAIASGTMARARLPSPIGYEDEANTWAAVQTFSLAPVISDFSTAQHGHVSAATGGSLSATSIGSGTFARARLPAELCYEDEACTYAVRQIFQDGFTAALNAYFGGAAFFNDSATHAANLYVANPYLFQANGTLVGKTNTYLEGNLRLNATDFYQTTAASDTVTRIENTAASSASNNYDFYKSRGAGAASNGDVIGRYSYYGHDGTNYERCGIIQTVVEGTTGSNDMPMSIQFSTCADGTNSLLERLYIHHDGRLEIENTLDHDGSLVGFYGASPVSRASMTDNTGGVAGTTCAAIAAGAIYAQSDMTGVRNCLASILDILEDLGLTT